MMPPAPGALELEPRHCSFTRAVRQLSSVEAQRYHQRLTSAVVPEGNVVGADSCLLTAPPLGTHDSEAIVSEPGPPTDPLAAVAGVMHAHVHAEMCDAADASNAAGAHARRLRRSADESYDYDGSLNASPEPKAMQTLRELQEAGTPPEVSTPPCMGPPRGHKGLFKMLRGHGHTDSPRPRSKSRFSWFSPSKHSSCEDQISNDSQRNSNVASPVRSQTRNCLALPCTSSDRGQAMVAAGAEPIAEAVWPARIAAAPSSSEGTLEHAPSLHAYKLALEADLALPGSPALQAPRCCSCDVLIQRKHNVPQVVNFISFTCTSLDGAASRARSC